ncbi:hypothetical protein NIES2119_22070 [[Phormidium ambiguum] IAM M-71]|uniref:Uncharacterized protein n=1 Tax=[Phormidium ambiguum] IAM M-71 TaxID=454136 RepID=A0A1U7IB75_9CYAN|nr:hypothetical protein [Phormidium ambiguum]OKH33799.1 hypothetical protein NIES2119_22070 [Phormidium ambiguum IAM M-71]
MSEFWDQPIENETDKAFEWFCHYRDLGGERTLAKVAQKYGKNSTYERQLQKWSRQHHWVARTLSFDQHRHQLLLQEEEKVGKERARLSAQQWDERRTELRTKQWQMSQLLLAKAEEMLSFSLAERRWTFRDATSMIQLGVDLAKTATEVPSFDVYEAIRVLANSDMLPSEVCERVKELFDDVTLQIQTAFVQGCLDYQMEAENTDNL